MRQWGRKVSFDNRMIRRRNSNELRMAGMGGSGNVPGDTRARWARERSGTTTRRGVRRGQGDRALVFSYRYEDCSERWTKTPQRLNGYAVEDSEACLGGSISCFGQPASGWSYGARWTRVAPLDEDAAATNASANDRR